MEIEIKLSFTIFFQVIYVSLQPRLPKKLNVIKKVIKVTQLLRSTLPRLQKKTKIQPRA